MYYNTKKLNTKDVLLICLITIIVITIYVFTYKYRGSL